MTESARGKPIGREGYICSRPARLLHGHVQAEGQAFLVRPFELVGGHAEFLRAGELVHNCAVVAERDRQGLETRAEPAVLLAQLEAARG